MIGDCSFVLALRSRKVLVVACLQTSTAAVIKNKTLHFDLDNLSVILAVEWITGCCDNFRLLNQELVCAYFMESTTAIGDHRVTKLYQTVAHSAHKAIHIDKIICEVSTGLFK